MASEPRFVAPGGSVPPGRAYRGDEPRFPAAPADAEASPRVPSLPPPVLSPAMPAFVDVLRAIPYGQPLVAQAVPPGFARTSNALLEAIASAPPGTPVTEVLAGLAAVGGHGPGGLVYAIIETHPEEDKFRLGPHTKAPPLRGRDWPPVSPIPNRPLDTPNGPAFDKLADMLALFYCCFELSCTFTIGDETGANKVIPGTAGTDIKEALVVAWETAEENKVGKQPHVGAWLDGGKLQDALNKRTGKPTEWDNIDDISFDLKSGVASSTSESDPPSRSDLARRRAREAGSWKIKGPVVFTNRRKAIKDRRSAK